MWYVAQALRTGMPVQDIYEHSKIDPWFLNHLRQIIEFEEEIKGLRGPGVEGRVNPTLLRPLPRGGWERSNP